MIRKCLYHFVIAISVLAFATLAACAPATATTNPSTNPVNTAPPVAPATTISNTDSNPTAAAPAATASVPETGAASNLACGGGATSANVTPSLTEGPYYKSGSPEQADLYQDGVAGTKLVVTGYVYDTNCQPVANA